MQTVFLYSRDVAYVEKKIDVNTNEAEILHRKSSFEVNLNNLVQTNQAQKLYKIKNPEQLEINMSFDKTNKHIYIFGKEITEIKICNLLGQLQYQSSYKQKSEVNINYQNFERGLYLILIKTEHGLTSKKFVVQ